MLDRAALLASQFAASLPRTPHSPPQVAILGLDQFAAWALLSVTVLFFSVIK